MEGRVIKANEPNVELNMSRNEKGIVTNVFLTIKDHDGVEHQGTLLINEV